jgi:hypothetical protein
LHIIGRSRIDTWRKHSIHPTSHFKQVWKEKIMKIPFLNHFFSEKIVHRPIQVQGKSRVDTWLRQDPIRQKQTIRTVKIKRKYVYIHPFLLRFINLLLFMQEVVLIHGENNSLKKDHNYKKYACVLLIFLSKFSYIDFSSTNTNWR